MSGKQVDRAAERRRILRAIGRDETRSDGDGPDDGGAPVDAARTADGTASADVPDGQQSLPDGGAGATSPTKATAPDRAESDAGE